VCAIAAAATDDATALALYSWWSQSGVDAPLELHRAVLPALLRCRRLEESCALLGARPELQAQLPPEQHKTLFELAMEASKQQADPVAELYALLTRHACLAEAATRAAQWRVAFDLGAAGVRSEGPPSFEHALAAWQADAPRPAPTSVLLAALALSRGDPAQRAARGDRLLKAMAANGRTALLLDTLHLLQHDLQGFVPGPTHVCALLESAARNPLWAARRAPPTPAAGEAVRRMAAALLDAYEVLGDAEGWAAEELSAPARRVAFAAAHVQGAAAAALQLFPSLELGQSKTQAVSSAPYRASAECSLSG
jgi:hypothetical protein